MSLALRGLEELDGGAVGIRDRNVLAAGTALHRVPQVEAGLVQCVDCGSEIADFDHDPVIAAGLLADAAGQRPRTRCAGTAENQLELAERDLRESGRVLPVELEPQS